MPSLRGFYRPGSLTEAMALLAQDPDAKAVGGGVSLVAMLNARVIEPAALVSLAGIAEIRGISTLPDGRVRVGAFTRHCDVASCTSLLGAAAVVRHAASQIGSTAVRNMGTIGGAIAHADPGLDYPPALVAAGADIEIASTDGRRTVPAREFFVDWYTTVIEPGELVTAVFLPRPEAGGAGAYVKHTRVAGDFATASVAACLHPDGHLSVAVGSCGPTPIAQEEVNAMLSADRSDGEIARAGALLTTLADPLDDVRGSADYRRQLIPRLLLRAVRTVDAARGGCA